MATGPLAGLRVIELTDDTGRFAGKMLAESGASVAQVVEAPPFAGPAMRDAGRRRTRRAARLVVRRRQAPGRRRPRHRRRASTPTGASPRSADLVDRDRSRRAASPSSASTTPTSSPPTRRSCRCR